VRTAWIAGMFLAACFAWPVPSASASNDDPAKGYWLVSTAVPTSNEVIWGRLVVKDGSLTFFAPRGEWTTPLAAIKRIARVKGSDRSFEIETVNGDMLRVAVLGPQLLPASPKKAIQVIQRAVRETPRPLVTVTTTFGPTNR
jgi:hypothetical protein